MAFLLQGDRKVENCFFSANFCQQKTIIIPEPWETIDLRGLGSLKAFEKSRFNMLLEETDHVI